MLYWNSTDRSEQQKRLTNTYTHRIILCPWKPPHVTIGTWLVSMVTTEVCNYDPAPTGESQLPSPPVLPLSLSLTFMHCLLLFPAFMWVILCAFKKQIFQMQNLACFCVSNCSGIIKVTWYKSLNLLTLDPFHDIWISNFGLKITNMIKTLLKKLVHNLLHVFWTLIDGSYYGNTLI